MQGLEIARDFFERWGHPFLRAEFPALAGRSAAGRVFGSDVLGADDALSRDHDWGPQFDLFLSAHDFRAVGPAVAAALNRAAPNPWEGHRLAGYGAQSVRVHSIPQWFRERFRLAAPPGAWPDWRPIPEAALYCLRHAAIWVDGSGELSAWRTHLAHYPEPLRVARLSEECYNAWHYGEYNFVERVARRGEPLAVGLSLGRFIDAVMRLRLLLSGDFTPFWKWLPHAFRRLDGAAGYVPLLEALLRSGALDEQADLTRTICRQLHQELVDTGVITGTRPTPFTMPLFGAHLELQARAGTGQPDARVGASG
jgi:Domain of unknown function (DUF4037)